MDVVRGLKLKLIESATIPYPEKIYVRKLKNV